MPEAAHVAARPTLELVADLHLEVGDERGSTTARLTGDGSGLVFDVSDPRTLLRCLPQQGWRELVPEPSALSRFADIPVWVTSRGRRLGRVTVTRTGKVRVRPAWSGAPAVAWTAVGNRPARVAAGVVGALVVAAVLYLARRADRGGRTSH